MSDTETRSSFEQRMPAAFQQLVQAGATAELHFKDICDMEFTVQDGRLFLLSASRGKRSSIANLRLALQFLVEGKIAPQEVLRRVCLADIASLLMPVITNRSMLRLAGHGLPACEGVATGKVVFRSSDVLACVAEKTPVILVCEDIAPYDIPGVLRSNGVLSTRRGVSSHAALACRLMRKPCVCSYSPEQGKTENRGAVRTLFHVGSWITINGLTGEVFEGRARCKTPGCREYPELVALAEIVAWAIATGNVSPDSVGQVWRMNDFFLHAAPLSRGSIEKKAACRTSYLSFEPPSLACLKRVRQNLIPLAPDERDNYSEILLSMMSSQLRILSSLLGIGNHPRYFRPLWNPKQCVYRKNENEGTQLVGMEFFGLNHSVPHLLDVATITILLELDIRSEDSEWFLDFTNPGGESLVVASESVRAYRLLINDAEVQHEDIPLLYHSLRCREYRWRTLDQSGPTRSEVVNALAGLSSKKSVDAATLALCYELGLIRNHKLTLAGESLLGKLHRTKQYEFIKTNRRKGQQRA